MLKREVKFILPQERQKTYQTLEHVTYTHMIPDYKEIKHIS